MLATNFNYDSRCCRLERIENDSVPSIGVTRRTKKNRNRIRHKIRVTLVGQEKKFRESIVPILNARFHCKLVNPRLAIVPPSVSWIIFSNWTPCCTGSFLFAAPSVADGRKRRKYLTKLFTTFNLCVEGLHCFPKLINMLPIILIPECFDITKRKE